MKKEIADQWVAALRSGKYQQGTGCLRYSDTLSNAVPVEGTSFCCLGVLCDLYVEAHKDEPGWLDDDTIKGEEHHLPTEVMLWAGISSENGQLHNGPACIEDNEHEECPHVWHDNLVDMNDEGCTFEQIADVISSHVEDL